MHLPRLSLALSLAVIAIPAAMYGQDFDDIYYNPDAAPAPKVQQQAPAVADYPAADTYAYAAQTPGSVRDIDEYNRRGMFALPDTTYVAADGTPVDETFAYTRRIERFYDPDVVVASGDPTLTEIYYSPEPVNVNIYVDSPWGWSYAPIYAWGYPWYGSWWGPSWSWTWGWGPSYAWGWGYPWYGPSYGWGGWGWSYPSYGWGYYPPVPNRPHNHRHPGAWAQGSNRPGGTRPGQGDYRPDTRPGGQPGGTGNSGRPGTFRPATGNSTATTVRPGQTTGGFRPGVTTTPRQDNKPSGTVRPGTAPSKKTTTPVQRPATTTRPATNNSQPSHNTYRPSTGGTRNNSGSFGGSRSGNSGGGGGRHSGAGGGGARGGRR